MKRHAGYGAGAMADLGRLVDLQVPLQAHKQLHVRSSWLTCLPTTTLYILVKCNIFSYF